MNTDVPGAILTPEGHCQWRVWAPHARSVELVLFDAQGRVSSAQRMYALKFGFFGFERSGIQVGQRYAYRLDDGPPRPDPASRWQPAGVHHASAVWRPDDFVWTDAAWNGRSLTELVIYELHVGTFTPEGSFAAAIPRLPLLRELGVTAVELMPIGQFPGNRGWGYDGVYWYAVQQSYGGPTEFQRLVDACHAEGLAVILDVVYNHLGPEGNYLREFGPYFTERNQTPWGPALNWDGPGCRAVRDFALENARYWIRDFHCDGLRLDAVHSLHDSGRLHILAELKHVIAEEPRAKRLPIQVIAESDLNDVILLDEPARGGYGIDAQWNDDFHHAIHALLTRERAGYYVDFDDPPRQLAKAFNDVFVLDGGLSRARGRTHGRPTNGHAPQKFVVSIQTHDQVGNRARGERFAALLDRRQLRLAAGLLLLSPFVPLLFMGEEYGETRPFPYFCELGDESLRNAARQGRQREFAHFDWGVDWPDPCEYRTFESAKLAWRWPEGSDAASLRRLYQTLLSLRASHPALRCGGSRVARIWPDDETPRALWLERRASFERGVDIVFNLTDTPLRLPRWSTPSPRCLFNSARFDTEEARTEEPPPDQLAPWSFLIVEANCPVGSPASLAS